MHRLIWKIVYGVDPKEQIDHVDMDHSNNRLENLRQATHTDNLRNRVVQRNNKSTGLKGVYCRSETGKYRAYIGIDKKRRYLGQFDCVADAVAARAEAEIKFFGEFARLAWV